MTADNAPLSSSRIKELKAQAHHLDPVVLVGAAGLTPAVLREIDLALSSHELIKTRLAGDDRAARADMITAICEATGCTAVQQIGKLAVLFRPRPDEPAGNGPHESKQQAAARLARGDKPAAAGRRKKPAARKAVSGKAVAGKPGNTYKPRAKSSRK